MYIIILQRIVVSKYTVVDARSCEANTTTLKVDNTYACMIKRIILVRVQLCRLLHFPIPGGLEHHLQGHPAFLSLHYCVTLASHTLSILFNCVCMCVS